MGATLPRLALLAALATACSSRGDSPGGAARSSTSIAPEPPASASAAPAPQPDAGLARIFYLGDRTAFSPDSHRLVASVSERVLILPLPAGAPILTAKGPDRARVFAFSNDGAQLAVGFENGVVHLLDPATGARLAELPPGPDHADVQALAFSPDGSLLASATHRVDLWRVADRKLLCSGESYYSFQLAFTPDGRGFAGVGPTEHVAWDTAACKERGRHTLQTGGTFPSVISPDAAWVASAEGDGHGLSVYSTRPWALRASLPGASSCQDHVTGLHFSPKGLLLTSGQGHWARSYQPRTLKPITAWKADPWPAAEWVGFFDDGQRAIYGSTGGVPSVVDLNGPMVVTEIDVVSPLDISPSPDGAYVAGITDRDVVLWDAATGKVVRAVTPDLVP